jgi:hypothetical protein
LTSARKGEAGAANKERKMKLSALLMLACLALSTLPASAEETTQYFLNIYDRGAQAERISIETHLSDNQNGLSWANAYLNQKNLPKIYCIADGKVPSGSQLVGIIRRQADADPRLKMLPIGMALMIALQAAFPC